MVTGIDVLAGQSGDSFILEKLSPSTVPRSFSGVVAGQSGDGFGDSFSKPGDKKLSPGETVTSSILTVTVSKLSPGETVTKTVTGLTCVNTPGDSCDSFFPLANPLEGLKIEVGGKSQSSQALYTRARKVINSKSYPWAMPAAPPS